MSVACRLSTLGACGLVPGVAMPPGGESGPVGLLPTPLLGKDWGQEGSGQERRPQSQGLAPPQASTKSSTGAWEPQGLATEGVCSWAPADLPSHLGTSPGHGRGSAILTWYPGAWAHMENE